jgi:predicted RND superfamily exporter protein
MPRLASIFLSAGVVGFALYTLIALASLVLSLVWKIPLQPGLVFTAIDGFSQAMVWLSFVTALTMAFHPVIAVMVALFLNDGIFYQLKYLVESARVADNERTWLIVAGFSL